MSEPIKNIVVVGRTGNGKSATGNSLIGQQVFLSKPQALGVTKKCKMIRAAIQDGPIVNVIDTPGLFDLSASNEYTSKELMRCLTLAEGQIHAVLFVLSVKTRISQEEEYTLNMLQSLFGSQIIDYLIVVFTGGDELEANNQTLKDYFRGGCPDFLTRILRLCGGRKVLFDNMTTNRDSKAKQIKELMAHVATIEYNTRGIPYIHEMDRPVEVEDALFESWEAYESACEVDDILNENYAAYDSDFEEEDPYESGVNVVDHINMHEMMPGPLQSRTEHSPWPPNYTGPVQMQNYPPNVVSYGPMTYDIDISELMGNICIQEMPNILPPFGFHPSFYR